MVVDKLIGHVNPGDFVFFPVAGHYLKVKRTIHSGDKANDMVSLDLGDDRVMNAPYNAQTTVRTYTEPVLMASKAPAPLGVATVAAVRELAFVDVIAALQRDAAIYDGNARIAARQDKYESSAFNHTMSKGLNRAMMVVRRLKERG